MLKYERVQWSSGEIDGAGEEVAVALGLGGLVAPRSKSTDEAR